MTTNYWYIIPLEKHICGNCRFWDAAHVLELPMLKEKGNGVLAPCKRFIPEGDGEYLNGDRLLMDENTPCPRVFKFMPSRRFLAENPHYKEKLKQTLRLWQKYDLKPHSKKTSSVLTAFLPLPGGKMKRYRMPHTMSAFAEIMSRWQLDCFPNVPATA